MPIHLTKLPVVWQNLPSGLMRQNLPSGDTSPTLRDAPALIVGKSDSRGGPEPVRWRLIVRLPEEAPLSSTPERPSGLFVALEGPDGSGKTTQAASLADWLGSLGREVVACREPGGTALGERLRSILLDRSDLSIGMRAEMLLFMSSRAQLIEEVIRPALARGAVVVVDRFLLSTVVYQGYAGGLDVEQLWQVGLVATGGLLPDLTLLVDVPPEVARGRIGPGRDRIEDRGEDSRRRVREGFLSASKDYPAPLVVVDGSGDVESVSSRLQSEVMRALALDPRS
jgi:dTMP kinase